MNESCENMHVILQATSGWRQALVMPAIAQHTEGVVLDRRTSICMLWFELPSGKIAGLTFNARDPYLSMRAVELIADRLKSAQNGELEKVPLHLSKLMGWISCSFASDNDLQEIAEELVREEIRNSKAWDHQYMLMDESLRRLAQPYHEQFCKGLWQFAAELEQDALKFSGFSEITTFPDAQSYNYLFHPISRISVYRRQAIQSVPLLAQALSTNSTEHCTRRLQQIVDSGNPIVPAVADYFRCSKNVARFLAGKDYALIGNEWKGRLDQLAGLLGCIKPAFWPKSPDDWHHLSQWLRPVYAALHNNLNERWYRIAEKGVNELASEGYEQIIPRMERHGVALADITTFPDFVKDLDKWARKLGRARGLIDEAVQQYSLLRLAQLSRRWHRWQLQMADLDPDEGREDTGASWLTFIDEPWEKRFIINGNYLVVPLNTPALLKEEGQRMQHCVGGYAARCFYGGSHIFSIRDGKTGLPLSTVELRLGVHDFLASDITVSQHYGLLNSQPSESCKSVLESFMKHIQTIPAERFKKVQEMHYYRNQLLQEQSLAAKVWSSKKVESFRELLRGYPALEEIGNVI
jgi:hypothetical protein